VFPWLLNFNGDKWFDSIFIANKQNEGKLAEPMAASRQETEPPVCVVCVECGASRPGAAYIEYSPGNIKLRRCAKCGTVVDKYVEYGDLLIAVDVFLHKTAAHRHIILNRGASVWSVAWAFCFNSMIEFYIRMHYLRQVGGVQEISGAVLSAATANFLSIIICLIGGYFLLRHSPDHFKASTIVQAVSLGSGPKVLFVIMSIWTYPLGFVLVLRALTVSCTIVALHASLADVSPTLVAILGLVSCSVQGLWGGIYLELD